MASSSIHGNWFSIITLGPSIIRLLRLFPVLLCPQTAKLQTWQPDWPFHNCEASKFVHWQIIHLLRNLVQWTLKLKNCKRICRGDRINLQQPFGFPSMISSGIPLIMVSSCFGLTSSPWARSFSSSFALKIFSSFPISKPSVSSWRLLAFCGETCLLEPGVSGTGGLLALAKSSCPELLSSFGRLKAEK